MNQDMNVDKEKILAQEARFKAVRIPTIEEIIASCNNPLDFLKGRKEAEEVYDSLCRTVLYDSKRKQWNTYMHENQALSRSDRLSCDQLLGVVSVVSAWAMTIFFSS